MITMNGGESNDKTYLMDNAHYIRGVSPHPPLVLWGHIGSWMGDSLNVFGGNPLPNGVA